MTRTIREKIAWSCLLALLLLAAAECGMRLRWRWRTGVWSIANYADKQHDLYLQHPYLRYVMKPLARRDGKDTAGEPLTNAQGWRGDIARTPKPAGVYRILCLGGSTTFTTVENYADAWPEVMRRALQQRHPGVAFEVVNAGVPGYTAFDSLLQYTLCLDGIDADCVIIHSGINDLQAAAFPDYQPDYSHLKKIRFWEDKAGPVERLLGSCMLYHRLRREIEGRLPNRKYDEVKRVATSNAILPRAREDLTRHLRHLAAVARGRGATVLFATFPIAYRLDMPAGEIEACAVHAAFWGQTLSTTGLALTMQDMNAGVIELGAEMDIPVAPVADAVAPGKANFEDLVHLTPVGERAAGECFAEALLRRNWIGEK